VDPNQQKEQFSNAFTRAVSAAAGFAVAEPSVDDDSVDIALIGGPGLGPRRPRLEAQLKCTEGSEPSGEDFGYQLRLKNYDDLRPPAEELCVPRILIVVRVPPGVGDWAQASDSQLVLRRCGYWRSLRGEPDVTNTTTVTVRIPVAQRLDVPQLQRLMGEVANGEWP
jgi:Domain of unknown function (DUF4365)